MAGQRAGLFQSRLPSGAITEIGSGYVANAAIVIAGQESIVLSGGTGISATFSTGGTTIIESGGLGSDTTFVAAARQSCPAAPRLATSSVPAAPD